MIKFNDGCHFYAQDGSPRYDADLRIARKDSLYVSPTTVDKAVFPNLFLERWKNNQLALAAAENPIQDEEPSEEYCNRIYNISMEKATNAAAFGKTIHAAIEKYPEWPNDPGLYPWAVAWDIWHKENIGCVFHHEKVVVDHDLGVAGMMDCVGLNKAGARTVWDWKTQDVKVDDKGRKTPAFYPSWTRQLSFYSAAEAKEGGLFPDIAECVSVVIDSNTPNEGELPGIYTKHWTREEIKTAYLQFVLGVWQYCVSRGKGGYWPGRLGRWNPETPGIPLL